MIHEMSVLEDYKRFLLALVGCTDIYDNDDHISKVVNALYDVNYIPKHQNDENRIEDSLKLRGQYLDLYRLRSDDHILFHGNPPSVLEVYVALVTRASETIINSDMGEIYAAKQMFLSMLTNVSHGLNIETMDDMRSIMIHVMHTNLHYNGLRGPFPLRNPGEDQNKVELWYQMMAYISENYDDYGNCIGGYL